MQHEYDIDSTVDRDEHVVEVVFRLKVRSDLNLNPRQVAREMRYSFTHHAINDAFIVDIVTED